MKELIRKNTQNSNNIQLTHNSIPQLFPFTNLSETLSQN